MSVITHQLINHILDIGIAHEAVTSFEFYFPLFFLNLFKAIDNL